jgi:hypothetical protein
VRVTFRGGASLAWPRLGGARYNANVVVSEGMELVIMFIVIMLNLLILVWLQKWSGLT